MLLPFGQLVGLPHSRRKGCATRTIYGLSLGIQICAKERECVPCHVRLADVVHHCLVGGLVRHFLFGLLANLFYLVIVPCLEAGLDGFGEVHLEENATAATRPSNAAATIGHTKNGTVGANRVLEREGVL